MPPFYIFPSNNKTMASYSESFSFSVVGCLMVRKKKEREEKREREKNRRPFKSIFAHQIMVSVETNKKKVVITRNNHTF